MKRRFIVGAVVTFSVLGIALPKVRPLWAGSESMPSPSPSSRARTSGGAALKVLAVEVRPQPINEVVSATGSLRADEEVELQAETNGKIIAIQFQEGTLVQRGDLLVKINDADLQASRQRANARMRLAEIREQRMATLVKQGGSNRQDYDTAASELEVQQAEIQLIEAQINKTEIRAPFNGVVGLRFVSEGSFVSPNSRIATLQKLETVKIDFTVPEKYMNRVRPGNEVQFTVAGDPRQFSGQIYAVEPRIDLTTRTVLIRANCSNTDGRLLPGSFAQVQLKLAEVSDALLVPAEAVVPGLSEKNVFLVEGGKAVRRLVRTGLRTESQVQVIEGLKPGDVVITSGLQQIRGGMPVDVLPAGKTAAN
jgi:membrane fusion protein (multidrug efflux system)